MQYVLWLVTIYVQEIGDYILHTPISLGYPTALVEPEAIPIRILLITHEY